MPFATIARLSTPSLQRVSRCACDSSSSIRLSSPSVQQLPQLFQRPSTARQYSQCSQSPSATRVTAISRPSSLSRFFSTSPSVQHAHLTPPRPGEERKVTFVDKEGDHHTFEVADGDNLLDIGTLRRLPPTAHLPIPTTPHTTSSKTETLLLFPD